MVIRTVPLPSPRHPCSLSRDLATRSCNEFLFRSNRARLLSTASHLPFITDCLLPVPHSLAHFCFHS